MSASSMMLVSTLRIGLSTASDFWTMWPKSMPSSVVSLGLSEEA